MNFTKNWNVIKMKIKIKIEKDNGTYEIYKELTPDVLKNVHSEEKLVEETLNNMVKVILTNLYITKNLKVDLYAEQI